MKFLGVRGVFRLFRLRIRGIPNFVSSHTSLPVLADINRILGNENAHIALERQQLLS